MSLDEIEAMLDRQSAAHHLNRAEGRASAKAKTAGHKQKHALNAHLSTIRASSA